MSEKVDTYSFGVVVLEIISGLKYNEMKVESAEKKQLKSTELVHLQKNPMHHKNSADYYASQTNFQTEH